jgi:hypothetical protein
MAIAVEVSLAQKGKGQSMDRGAVKDRKPKSQKGKAKEKSAGSSSGGSSSSTSNNSGHRGSRFSGLALAERESCDAKSGEDAMEIELPKLERKVPEAGSAILKVCVHRG